MILYLGPRIFHKPAPYSLLPPTGHIPVVVNGTSSQGRANLQDIIVSRDVPFADLSEVSSTYSMTIF